MLYSLKHRTLKKFNDYVLSSAKHNLTIYKIIDCHAAHSSLLTTTHADVFASVSEAI